MTASLKGLGSRAIKGAFQKRLEEVSTASWLPLVAMMQDSDQASESYDWLSDAPVMRKKGSNPVKTTPKRYELTVTNERYQSALEIDIDDWRRDKTGSILKRVNERAARAAQLPMRVLTDLINSNGNAYDGVAFFHASNHVNLNGDVIANAISVAAATGTTPTVAEASDGLLQGIQKIIGFKDDAGEPANEFAQQFLVMCPVELWAPIVGAIGNEFTTNGASNTLKATNFAIKPVLNARLTAVDKLFIFRTDADIKPLVWQDEVAPYLEDLNESSEYAKLNSNLLFQAQRVGGGGYGRFNMACQVTFT